MKSIYELNKENDHRLKYIFQFQLRNQAFANKGRA
jgi:hypothetical protein